jgi:hypothetical protein
MSQTVAEAQCADAFAAPEDRLDLAIDVSCLVFFLLQWA